MKTLAATTLLFLLTYLTQAQAPQQFSFQGVARDATGKVVANKTISLRLTIHSVTVIGQTEYQETHATSTSSAGIFTVKVGGGNFVSGTLADINWGANTYFLQVEIDPDGGISYINMGATQLLSVPYALYAEEAGRWADGNPIIQSGQTGQGGVLPELAYGNKLIWYPRKGAFRAGRLNPSIDAWDDVNIGANSAAFNGDTKASGPSSAAFGYGSFSSGFASFSAGLKTFAKAQNSFSVGSFNNTNDNPISDSPNPTDRIFQLGNGYGSDNRSNALTILRNGNVGIGNNALIPGYILDIGGRSRIRHNKIDNQEISAGLYFDDSKNNPEGFVGMKKDDEIGFYHTGKWSFWIDGQGSAHIANNVLQTSDRRLKKELSPINNSLFKLTEISGYHYLWKDSTRDQTLQTGLIAQDVEAIFPELVKTDDKGFKSVNYTGLIPHLIEAVKELKKENAGLRQSVSKLSQLESKVNELLEGVNALSASKITSDLHK